MDSQIDQEHNRHPQHVVGEEEDHHEKKSVMKKVKDKAKKIKVSLTKHSQGPDLHEEDADDNDGDPNVEHSATTTRGGTPGDTSPTVSDDDPLVPNQRTDRKIGDRTSGQSPMPHEEISGQHRGSFGKTTMMGEGLTSPQKTPVSSFAERKSDVGDETRVKQHGPTGLDENSPVHRANVTGNEGHSEESIPVSSLGEYKSKISDPSHTFVTGKEGHLGQSGVNLDQSKINDPSHTSVPGKERNLGESGPKANPQAYSASNEETKVTDPVDEKKVNDPTHAGGEEIGITPIVHSFNKMNINSGSEQNQDQKPVSNLPTGSHDQFTSENPPNQTGSYTDRISNATSAISDKAISAKNVVASRLGYGAAGDKVATRSGPTEQTGQQGKGIAATVYEKVAGAGSTVMSKIPGGAATGTKDTTGQDKGGSVKGYLSEKLKPGEEDKALSEVITETLHKPKAAAPKPVAEVKESAEVTRRLGPDQGEEQVEQSSYGKVVAETLKGAVGSLFGKKTDPSQTDSASPKSLDSSTGTERRSRGGVAEERRLEGN